ncbi:GTP pyrophosphokinase [Methylobacterium flocculans]|uniref:GTP pyrophosphokinase n=1 Tax=Methylobacterium flocculans TaxID=2984843 RepID=UPI0021F3A398|nr:RelA/SpoT domain-containing protein [Methylobacterium sp. FF17]
MTEEQFLARWKSERGMYEAWGQHVASKIIEGIGKVAPFPADLFIRIPPKPRAKTEASILEKAFRRNKNYTNPYAEITDKIGVRFVVLLGRDIDLICQIIEECVHWTCSRDRDFQREQEERPIHFEYAAVHFVVRCRYETRIGNHLVMAETPCEVQVKTILQHAYSELTHDTLYKPSVIASAGMKREAAKSMALLEATGDYFEKVVTLVEAATEPAKGLSLHIGEIYRNFIGRPPEVTRAEGLILEAYDDNIGTNASERVKALLIAKPYICKKIQARAANGLLYRQPSILIVYLMVAELPSKAKTEWPFVPDELRPIYTDLGISFDGY